MNYEISKSDNTMDIKISDQLIYSDTANFASILHEVSTSKASIFVLSLSQLEHVDSSGLRMFFLLHDACKEKGGSLSIKRPKGQVRDMLLHCRFDTLVPIVDA